MWSHKRGRATAGLAVLLVLVAGLVGLACSQATPAPTAAKGAAPAAAPAPKAAKAEWKWASIIPAGQEYQTLFKELAASIEKATDGQVKVTVYPAGELPYSPTEYLRNVRDGLVEVAEIGSAMVVGDAPIMALTDLPYVALDDKEQDTMDKTIRPYVVKELEKWGGVIIAENPYGRRQISTKPAVKDLSGLNGLKVRAIGGLENNLLSTWGAIPTAIVWAEVYPAAQRGVIEGVMTATLAIEQSKVYEVTPYLVRVDAHRTQCFITVSRTAWNALSPDAQQKVLAAGQEWEQKWKQLVLVDWEKASIDRMLKAGQIKAVVEVSQKDKLATREKMLPAVKSFVSQRAGATGDEALGKVLAAVGIK